jgi:hypothetical protein
MHISENKKSILLCAVLGCTAEIAAGLILGSILAFFPDTAAGYQGQMDSQLSGGLMSLFLVIIFSPVFEEGVFRFILLGFMEKRTGFAAANIIQALLFGIYHMNPVQGIYAFLLGALIGLLKHYSGTVLSCICFHVAFNITGVLVNRYMPVEISRGIRIALLLISLSASAALFIMIRRNRYGVQKA